jgi:uncharacterized protein
MIESPPPPPPPSNPPPPPFSSAPFASPGDTNTVSGPPSSPLGEPGEYTPYVRSTFAPPTFAPPTFAPPTFAPPRPAHPTLPLAAGLGALVVLTISLFASKFVLDVLVDFDWPVVTYVVLLAVIGYGPSLLWWWFAMRRWGSGAPLSDVGITPRWADIGWGPVIWICTIIVQVAIGAIVLALDIPLQNNTDDIGDLSVDRTYTIAIVIAAVIAAPIVEELVFRGLVMRSLLSKIPVVGAVALQGILFGVAHVDPVRGSGNLGLVMVLSGVGISFGAAAYWLRRIGPTMVAHAIFNGVVMILLLTGVRDKLIEDNPDLFDEQGSIVEQISVVDQANISEPHRRRDPDATR